MIYHPQDDILEDWLKYKMLIHADSILITDGIVVYCMIVADPPFPSMMFSFAHSPNATFEYLIKTRNY